MVATDKKEYISCGYSQGYNSGDVVYGIINKLDHIGNFVWQKTVDFYTYNGTAYTGQSIILRQMAKAIDGYAAVGYSVDKIVLVEVDNDGNYINGTPLAFDIPTTTAPDLMSTYLSGISVNWSNTAKITGLGNGNRGYSIAVDPTTNLSSNLIIGAQCDFYDITTSFEYRMAAIITLNYASTTWTIGKRYIGGENYNQTTTLCAGSPLTPGGNRIVKLLTKVKTGGYDIYGCGAISGPDDHIKHCTSNIFGYTEVETYDKDVWLIKLPNDYSAITFSNAFDKTNIRLNGTSGTAISTVNSSTYPYQEAGPLTARNFDPSNGFLKDYFYDAPGLVIIYSDATQYLNSDNNKNEEAHDMIFTADGNLAVISAVNIIGANIANNGNNKGTAWLGYPSLSGTAMGFYKEYQDEDGFLLKFDLSGNLLHAKNVGHFSGTIFQLNIEQNLEPRFCSRLFFFEFVLAETIASIDFYCSKSNCYAVENGVIGIL